MAKLKLPIEPAAAEVDIQPPIAAAAVTTTADRAATVAAIRNAENNCRYLRKDGSESRPDGLAQFCCIQGWPLDAAEKAFAHFMTHGWFEAGGNIWGEKA